MAEVKKVEMMSLVEGGIPTMVDEDTAMRLVKNIFDKFNWQGTFFTPEDVRTNIVHQFLVEDSDPPEGDELERMVESAMDEADWENIGEWMTEECWGPITDAIYRTIKENN